MSILQTLKDSAIQARKDRDTIKAVTLNTFLEGMRSDIMGELSMAMYGIYAPKDEVVIRYLKNAIKTSNGAIVSAQKVSTPSSISFIQKTQAEILLLESFLPKQLSDEELRVAIAHAIGDSELTGGKLMGYVMSELKRQYEGLFDAAKVRTILVSH